MDITSKRCQESVTNRKLGTINIGSRRSQLALIQTKLVIERLERFYSNNPDRLRWIGQSTDRDDPKLEFDVVTMTTTGDKILDKPLPTIGSKSLFTGELEVALLDGKVDFVVHSLKDLPTTLPEGCAIGAILKRDSPDDAIVMKKSLRSKVSPIDLLLGRNRMTGPDKIKIGTSSHISIAMIKRGNSDIESIDIRGNLNTRISKLDDDEGEYAAIVLAKAGLDRMGWSDRASCLLRSEDNEAFKDWCYAVGQGAIAVECRSNDNDMLRLLWPIAHMETTYEVVAERSLMRTLEAGCSVPIGVRSSWSDCQVGITLRLEGVVLSLDGKVVIRADDRTIIVDRAELRSESSTGLPLESSTSIIVSEEDFLLKSKVEYNLRECSLLGMRVANKLIGQGCLSLIKR